MNPLPALLALCCQDPMPGSPAAARAHDVVVLKNGDELQGRILTEVAGYVELELEPGAVVGFTTTEVDVIRRGAAAPPVANAIVPARGEWFVLHDATGRPVGWLASSVTHRGDGGFTVNEEYEFHDGPRRYQVTTLATADGAHAPVNTYFRERVTEPVLALARLPVVDPLGQHDRVVDERIVEATCHGELLVVQRLDRNGRHERTLAWPAGASFPLLARALARATGGTFGAATLFDPATEEIVARAYDGSRQRSVVVDGKTVQVTEVCETSRNGRNAEWLDASARTLRRELAGPALVAVPSSASLARGMVGGAIAAAIVAAADHDFGLWVPNPAWTVQEGVPAARIALECAAHGASISLSRLDHLEHGTALDVAADAVANWFVLLQPELRVVARGPGTVRDRTTVQLQAEGTRAGVASRATVDVIPHHDGFLVLVCVAPTAAWQELAADFAFLRRSVELQRQSLAPRLQGPLAEGSEEPVTRGSREAPRAAAPAMPREPGSRRTQPVVRVPAGS